MCWCYYETKTMQLLLSSFEMQSPHSFDIASFPTLYMAAFPLCTHNTHITCQMVYHLLLNSCCMLGNKFTPHVSKAEAKSSNFWNLSRKVPTVGSFFLPKTKSFLQTTNRWTNMQNLVFIKIDGRGRLQMQMKDESKAREQNTPTNNHQTKRGLSLWTH